MANEKHLLVTFGGDYTDTQNATEVWQNGIRFALANSSIDDIGTLQNNWDVVPINVNRTETNWTITGNWRASFGGGLFFNPDDWLNDQIAPAIDTWLGISGVADRVRLRWAKVFPIGTNGKAIPAPPYSSGTPMLLTWTGSYPTGDDGANLLPLQNSVVVSHRTPQIGRRGRGRAYRAGISTNANDTHGMIGSTYVTGFANAEKALLEALSGIYGVTDHTYTRAIVTGSPWTQYGAINQVRVGNRMDTQRRRRKQLLEEYTSVTVDAP